MILFACRVVYILSAASDVGGGSHDEILERPNGEQGGKEARDS